MLPLAGLDDGLALQHALRPAQFVLETLTRGADAVFAIDLAEPQDGGLASEDLDLCWQCARYHVQMSLAGRKNNHKTSKTKMNTQRNRV